MQSAHLQIFSFWIIILLGQECCETVIYGPSLQTYSGGTDTGYGTRVYKSSFGNGSSGKITRISFRVAEANRKFSVGVYEKTGTSDCEMGLIKQISIDLVPEYQSYLTSTGDKTIDLNPEHYLSVAPSYYFGMYWENDGTITFENNTGYHLCSLTDNVASKLIPYDNVNLNGAAEQRTYAVNVDFQKLLACPSVPPTTRTACPGATPGLTEQQCLDLHPMCCYESKSSNGSSTPCFIYSDIGYNWVLNDAIFHNTSVTDRKFSNKNRSSLATDGDYSTCQSLPNPGGTFTWFQLDLMRRVNVQTVRVKINKDFDFTVGINYASVQVYYSSSATVTRTKSPVKVISNGFDVSCGSHSGATTNGFATVNCAGDAIGRHVMIQNFGSGSGMQICEIEVITGILHETTINNKRVFLLSQTADSPGSGQAICRRRYATATLFEPSTVADSGALSAWMTANVGDYKMEHLSDCLGNDMVIQYKDSPYSCFQFCKQTTNCIGYVYGYNGITKCHLKSICTLNPEYTFDGPAHPYLISAISTSYIALIGAYYKDGSWRYQSTGVPIPVGVMSFRSGQPAGTYNYASVDGADGKLVGQQSSLDNHHVLCQVSTAISNAPSRVVFRARAGYGPSSGESLYSLWTSLTQSYPALNGNFTIDLYSTNASVNSFFMSPVLKCGWGQVKEVRISYYRDAMELAFVNFDVNETTSSDWFSSTTVAGSSYQDLPLKAANVSVAGDGLRRFLFSDSSSNCTLSGWMAVLDTDNAKTCPWENFSNFPQFIYSRQGSADLASDWVAADVYTISVRLDPSSFGGSCTDSCDSISDGLYQSCVACNVYVQCSSNVLTYNLCGNGDKFDSSTNTCTPSSTTCTGSTTSQTCQAALGCPSPNPCGIHGRCDASSGSVGWICHCDPGYYGPICTEADECYMNNQCLNGATCVDGSNTFNCTCPPYSSGQYCESLDHCASQSVICENGGNCTYNSTTWQCNCTVDYFGRTCQRVRCPSPNPCGIHGRCDDSSGSVDWICNCDPGYYGQLCTETDECYMNNQCLNGATCVDGNSTFNCTCPPYSSGQYCESLDHCASQSVVCENGGNCTYNSTTWQCNCTAGYIGRNCQSFYTANLGGSSAQTGGASANIAAIVGGTLAGLVAASIATCICCLLLVLALKRKRKRQCVEPVNEKYKLAADQNGDTSVVSNGIPPLATVSP